MHLDLSTLVAKDTTEVQLRHPLTKELTQAFVVLFGPAADAYTTAQIKAYQSAKANVPEGGTLDPKMAQDTMLELLIDCVKDWRGIGMGGEVLECTPANVRKILTTPGYYWIKDQLAEAVNDVRRFF